jgi:hypothetical protein
MLEKKLIDIMKTNDELMRDLELVRDLELPEWYIAAGYVRNFIWDHLHEYAMKRWPETATAVAVSLDKYNQVTVIAPHGLNDLFDLVIRRSPHFKDKEYFHSRVHSKRWLELWPQLNVLKNKIRG